jgi:hypothetical protein
MPWRFDPIAEDIVWTVETSTLLENAAIDLGSAIDSDLSIDTGSRSNDSSIIDQGLRVIDGSI